jgi:hypothetical protein
MGIAAKGARWNCRCPRDARETSRPELSAVNGRSLVVLASLLVAGCQGVIEAEPGGAGPAGSNGPPALSGAPRGTGGSSGGKSGSGSGGMAQPAGGATGGAASVALGWSPAVGSTWQWQLTGTIDQTVSAQMFDVDLFDTPATTVASLHAAGHPMVCYVNAGAFENWRPDAAQFPAAVKGKGVSGWQGEQWLDVRQWSVLQPIVEARMDQCRSKGFDGIELDNVDGYSNDTGFPLTAADQLAFNRALASSAHARGLSVGLKNDLDQVPDLVGQFDWALNEQCFEFGECNALKPFVNAHKAVFNVEYNLATSSFCSQADAMGLSSMLKHTSLDAYRVACP